MLSLAGAESCPLQSATRAEHGDHDRVGDAICEHFRSARAGLRSPAMPGNHGVGLTAHPGRRCFNIVRPEVHAISLALLISCGRIDDRMSAPARIVPPATAAEPAAPSPLAATHRALSEENHARSPVVTQQEPGTADLDPNNDEIVAPPEAIADCEARLAALGVSYAAAELKLHTLAGGRVCGAPQALVYKGRRGGIRWSPPPVVTCSLALALARFELLVDAEAQQYLGVSVRSIEQGGSYNCRNMARFSNMVSEHSYGNAIDVLRFRLRDGRTLSVLQHFGRPGSEPTSAEGKFLRALARRAFDDGVFSVVLTEFFDRLHRDHFHLDMARYRVDGTR